MWLTPSCSLRSGRCPKIQSRVIRLTEKGIYHGRNTRRALVPVMLIVIVAILATVLHWSILDAREAEYRVFSSERMFW